MTNRLPTFFTGAFLLLSAGTTRAESFLRLPPEGDLAGLAVHIASRLEGLAGAGVVVAAGTLKGRAARSPLV